MNEDRANVLAALPWTYLGPIKKEVDGRVWFELRIAELPDFFLASESAAELFREVRPALVTFVLSYLEHNEQLPHPPVRWLFGSQDSVNAPVKSAAPVPAPGKVWNDKIPGVSGNALSGAA